MSALPGNTYHHIQISGNARVLLGNAVGQVTDSTLATRADYVGQYANSSLRPVTNYVPRPRLHQKIKEQLHDQKDNDGRDYTRVLVVYGLGGAGKSQLVLQYIQEYRRDYIAVFWIEAGSKETIERDYVQIYQLLYGRQADAGQAIVKVEEAVPAVKRWFQGREGRTDTIDNNQHRSYIDLEYFIPNAPGIHIIITSRSSTAKEIIQLEAVEVAEIEALEATELFKRSAKIKEAGQKILEEISAIGQDRLEVDDQRQLSLFALELVADTTAKKGIDLSYRIRVVPHVISCFTAFFQLYEALGETAEEILGMINRIGDFLYRLGRWTEAYEIQIFHFTKVEKLLGKKHPDTLTSMNNLASVLDNQGKYEEAEGIHRQALALREAELGKKHLSTLRSMNNLVSVLNYQGKYEEAEGTYRQALALSEAELGKKHPDTLTSINNLAVLLGHYGKYEEAEGTYRQALALEEAELGKKHPHTLISMNNLASVLNHQGKYEEAEEIHRQALALKEIELGRKHPSTLRSMNNLASVLDSQGKYEEAEEIHRQALALKYGAA
ncbi:MAG: hypothetical protein Q9188_005374 [Gyalolechia gomerana]